MLLLSLWLYNFPQCLWLNFQKQSQSAVSEIYASSLDPSKGRLTTVDANAILDHERKWGPKNGFSVPKDYDHVMYWIG